MHDNRGILAQNSHTCMMLDGGLNNSIFITQTWERHGGKATAHLIILSDKLFKVVYLLSLFARRWVPYWSVAVFVLGCLGMAEKSDVSCMMNY